MRFLCFTLVFFFACSVSSSAKNVFPKKLSADEVKISRIAAAYLRHGIGQKWEDILHLMSERSFQLIKRKHIARIKSARTIEEEDDLLKSLGVKSIQEAKVMDLKDFFVAYHKSMRTLMKLDSRVLDEVRATLDLHILCVGVEEKGTLAHILIRAKHSRQQRMISSLELVSLRFLKGRWQISLFENVPDLKQL